MKRIVAALNRSYSIHSIHLDGNPCINDSMIDFIHKRIRTVDPYEPINHIAHPPKIKQPGTRMMPAQMQETLRLK